MAEEDRLDMISVSSEDGEELMMQVEQYFYYNGEEYVYLREVADATEPESEPGNEYVMLVETSRDEEGEEVEDFVPIAPGLMESLLMTLRTRYRLPDEESAPGQDE